MAIPILCVALAYPLSGGTDGFFQQVSGTGLGSTQPGFEFAKGEFDGIKIGRIRGQVQEAGPVSSQNISQARYFMGGQIVEHHHVAWLQSWPEHLAEIGRKNVPVYRAINTEQRAKALRSQGGDKRDVGAIMQGNRLVYALPVGGPAVAATIREVGAGFIHKNKPGYIFLRQGFQKRPPQAHYSFAVALAGMDAFFYAPTPFFLPLARCSCD